MVQFFRENNDVSEILFKNFTQDEIDYVISSVKLK